jgi:hypothetical protein
LVALLLAKLVATSLTLGSLDGAVGSLFGRVFPSIGAPPGAYALVAMGAAFGGAGYAPITAILILFEMTGDDRIILPLLTAVVVSTLVFPCDQPGDDRHDQAPPPRCRHPRGTAPGPIGTGPGGGGHGP